MGWVWMIEIVFSLGVYFLLSFSIVSSVTMYHLENESIVFKKLSYRNSSNSKVFLERLGTVGLLSLMSIVIGSSLHSSPSGVTDKKVPCSKKIFHFISPVNCSRVTFSLWHSDQWHLRWHCCYTRSLCDCDVQRSLANPVHEWKINLCYFKQWRVTCYNNID